MDNLVFQIRSWDWLLNQLKQSYFSISERKKTEEGQRNFFSKMSADHRETGRQNISRKRKTFYWMGFHQQHRSLGGGGFGLRTLKLLAEIHFRSWQPWAAPRRLAAKRTGRPKGWWMLELARRRITDRRRRPGPTTSHGWNGLPARIDGRRAKEMRTAEWFENCHASSHVHGLKCSQPSFGWRGRYTIFFADFAPHLTPRTGKTKFTSVCRILYFFANLLPVLSESVQ